MGKDKKQKIKIEDNINLKKRQANKTITKAVEQNENSKKKEKIYIGFNTRLTIKLILCIIFLIASIFFLSKSFSVVDEKKIEYSEKSNLDYRVYLKENEFYETPYLGKDMLYIASLIDNIKIDFDYNFVSKEGLDLNFSYDVIGKLVISDSLGKNKYFEKEYTLLSNKSINLKGNANQNIKEQITIDYGYYNNLANQFKMSYGLDTVSNLIVYLTINKNSENKDDLVFAPASVMYITIPLSEKSVDISMEYNQINNSSKVISKSNIMLDNIIYMLLSVICIVMTIVLCIKCMRLIALIINKKGKYDKFIERILKEYDRLVVETQTFPNLDKLEVLKINKFEELLDVRDNLKLPIMYYVISKHQKCCFYIKHDKEIYLLVVKSVDLEEQK